MGEVNYMRRRFTKKGQSTLEYAILILIVIVALLAMQVYLKRALQGRMRESSENIGQAYSPGYTTSSFSTTSTSSTTEEVNGGAGTSTTTLNDRTDNRQGNEAVSPYAEEYWPGQ
jgi:hypothetical protein